MDDGLWTPINGIETMDNKKWKHLPSASVTLVLIGSWKCHRQVNKIIHIFVLIFSSLHGLHKLFLVSSPFFSLTTNTGSLGEADVLQIQQ